MGHSKYVLSARRRMVADIFVPIQSLQCFQHSWLHGSVIADRIDMRWCSKFDRLILKKFDGRLRSSLMFAWSEWNIVINIEFEEYSRVQIAPLQYMVLIFHDLQAQAWISIRGNPLFKWRVDTSIKPIWSLCAVILDLVVPYLLKTVLKNLFFNWVAKFLVYSGCRDALTYPEFWSEIPQHITTFDDEFFKMACLPKRTFKYVASHNWVIDAFFWGGFFWYRLALSN